MTETEKSSDKVEMQSRILDALIENQKALIKLSADFGLKISDAEANSRVALDEDPEPTKVSTVQPSSSKKRSLVQDIESSQFSGEDEQTKKKRRIEIDSGTGSCNEEECSDSILSMDFEFIRKSKKGKKSLNSASQAQDSKSETDMLFENHRDIENWTFPENVVKAQKSSSDSLPLGTSQKRRLIESYKPNSSGNDMRELFLKFFSRSNVTPLIDRMHKHTHSKLGVFSMQASLHQFCVQHARLGIWKVHVMYGGRTVNGVCVFCRETRENSFRVKNGEHVIGLCDKVCGLRFRAHATAYEMSNEIFKTQASFPLLGKEEQTTAIENACKLYKRNNQKVNRLTREISQELAQETTQLVADATGARK